MNENVGVEALAKNSNVVQVVRNDETPNTALQKAAADYINSRWYNALWKKIRYNVVKNRYQKTIIVGGPNYEQQTN